MDKKELLKIVLQVLKWFVALLTSYLAGLNQVFNS